MLKGLLGSATLLFACEVSAQVPTLVSVTPADGATEVSTASSLVFVFDRPMDTSVSILTSISFMGFNMVGNLDIKPSDPLLVIQGTWGEDERTLTCDALSGTLPTGTLVTWTLNPPGMSPAYADPLLSLEGVQLATVSGTFTTSGQGGGGGGDEDCNGTPDAWGSYSVFKGAEYSQNSTANPVPVPTDAFLFSATVSGPQNGPTVTAASVTLPAGTAQTLTEIFQGSGLFFFTDSAATESALDQAYPQGSYSLRFTRLSETERTISMPVPANTVPIPKILNYAEAQSINAAQDFTLNWNAFTGAASDDTISLTIQSALGDILFEAPDWCIPRELRPTDTSIVIPANTLAADQTYTGHLAFGRTFYSSTNQVPEMSGFGALLRDTTFTLSTGGGGVTPMAATLGDAQILPNGHPQLTLSGTAGRDYRVQRTQSLSNPIWADVGAVTLDGAGSGLFEDITAPPVDALFYRALAD